MSLTYDEKLEANALGNYAWGYFLSLDATSELGHVVDKYLASLDIDPGSEFLVKELLDAWSSTDAQYENSQIITHLSELARSRPDAVSVNLVVANAYIANRRYAKAEQLLLNLFKQTQWTEPIVIRELVICYIGSKQIRKAHRLLRKATSQRRFGGDYIVEHTAAVFYNTVSNTDDFNLSEKDKRKYQDWAYKHAIKAADAVQTKSDMNRYGELMALTALLLRGSYTSRAISLLASLPERGLESDNSRAILAECYESIERRAEALEIWRHLSKSNPFDSNYHIRIAHLLKQSKSYKDALFEFKSAYQLRTSPELAYEISVLSVNLDHLEDALAYALQSPPERLSTWLLQSYIYQRFDQQERALAVLEDVKNLAVIPNESVILRSSYYLTVATLSHSLGRIDDAVSSLEKALKLQPNDPEMNNFLGYLLADENRDLEHAESLIRTALKFEPQNAAYLDSLAWALFRQGKYSKAAIYIEQAISLQEDEFDGIIFDHAGDIFNALGDISKAQSYWKRALKHKINSPDNVK